MSLEIPQPPASLASGHVCNKVHHKPQAILVQANACRAIVYSAICDTVMSIVFLPVVFGVLGLPAPADATSTGCYYNLQAITSWAEAPTSASQGGIGSAAECQQACAGHVYHGLTPTNTDWGVRCWCGGEVPTESSDVVGASCDGGARKAPATACEACPVLWRTSETCGARHCVWSVYATSPSTGCY